MRAGRALARCHAVARETEVNLDPFGGSPPIEAFSLFAELVDRGVIDAARGRRVARLAAEGIDTMEGLELSKQIIHGDAHLENLLGGTGDPLWSDWEDTFCGPLEWDIACLVATAQVTARGAPEPSPHFAVTASVARNRQSSSSCAYEHSRWLPGSWL